MKTYKANKNGPLKYLMMGYLIVLVIIFFLDKETFFERTYLFIPFIAPCALGLWALFNTYYQIKEDKLIYRSGFIRGEIDIRNIKEILKGKNQMDWFKAGLGHRRDHH